MERSPTMTSWSWSVSTASTENEKAAVLTDGGLLKLPITKNLKLNLFNEKHFLTIY